MTHRKSTLFWVVTALTLYLALSLTYLSLPGLQYDEVNFVNAALGRHDASFIVYEHMLFGKKVPLMIMSYIGALKSGIFAPIFFLFGRSAVTVRLPVVCIGFFTLIISYAVYSRLFDRRVAILGLLLFATDPTFIFANRMDWGPVSLMLVLEVSSLYFMWRWQKEEKGIFLCCAGLLFGLGLYNKIIFGWYLAAFFISFAMFFWTSFKKLLYPRNLIYLLLLFLLGCSPLIAFNKHSRMGTFRRETLMPPFNHELLRNRYYLFRDSLDGEATYFLFTQSEVSEHPSIFPNTSARGTVDFYIAGVAGFEWVRRSILPFALVLSLLFIIIVCAFGRIKDKRHILFMTTQLLVITALICITAKANGTHHVIAIYPFIFAVIAFAASEFARLIGQSRGLLTSTIPALCILPLMTAQLVVGARHLHSFHTNGGVGYWSNAIYDLASYVRLHPEKRFILMEWGMGNQLSLLSDKTSSINEFVCDPPSTTETCLEPLLNAADTLLVFYAHPFGNNSIVDAYRGLAAKNGQYAQVKKSFLQGDGRPVYIVLETMPRSSETASGNVYYKREAEEFNSKKGGGIDPKLGASNNASLGNFWGLGLGDFASYRFTLDSAIPNAHIYLRYAFENPTAQSYYLFLDGQFLNEITLPPTYGYGTTAEEWQIAEADLGYLMKGMHEFTIKPTKSHEIVNLDFFVIRN